MGGGYEPFPIYDFRSGLQFDREPWMLPTNAFSEALNVYFYKGRVYKRKGYERFATGTGGSGINVLASPPVMGIYEYYTSDGNSSLLALDTDYLYEYNDTNDDWEGVEGYLATPTKTPDFTGSATDFFWSETWQDLIFFTNNVNAIKYWDGTDLTALSGTNVPGTCKLLVSHKNRLIALNTYESAVRYPQRYRCSNVGSYSDWDDDIYADADTVDWITGVSFVRGEMMVFFERSVWWLRYTGDADVPFSWEKIADTEGIYATYSVVDFENEAVGLGPTSWIGCDGLQVYSVDDKVPDLVLDMNSEKVELSYGFIADELRQYLCSYTTASATNPDRILVYNYTDSAFSIYLLPTYVFGYWGANDPPVIDDYDAEPGDIIDENYDVKIDTKILASGYPINLMGDRDGYVNKLFTINTDLPVAGVSTRVYAALTTKRLVPYPDASSKLGYFDIIGDYNESASLNVFFYKDYRSEPYKSVYGVKLNTITGGSKARVRIRVMENAKENHTIRITESTNSEPFVIDALIPHFKKAGVKR